MSRCKAGAKSNDPQGTREDDLRDLFTVLEPLDPELERYMRPIMRGMIGVFHPLVYSFPYGGERENRRLNKQLAYKRQKLDEAFAAGEWSRYIHLHEKPYRVDALLDIREHIVADAMYWQLVANTWMNTENLYEMRARWSQLWHTDRPGRLQYVMDEDDQRRFEQFPDAIVIYRGSTNRAGALRGLSWTIDFNVASKMARRRGIASYYGPLLYVARGVVEKRHILAFFEGRGEEEIVVVPSHVRALTVTAFPRKYPL